METNTYYLSEIAEICDSRRIPLSAMERVKRHGKYRYYGAQGVIDYVDDFLFDGEYLLIAEDGENLKSLKQNIAQVVTGKFWVNNHAHIIQTNSKCRLRYLYYLINSMNISGYITGSAQPKLSQANMKKIELELPSVLMQDKILSVLGTIDDKIENNKKINKNLEQQAFAIFNKMFVDSIYGENFVGDILTPNRGKGLLSKDAVPGNVPVVAGGLEPATYHNQSNTVAPVLTISASGANAGYVNLWNVPVWSSDSSFIDTTMTEDVYFWYAMLKSRQSEIFDAQTGSAQPHIYPKHIAGLPMGNISPDEINQYTVLVSPLFEAIGANKEENLSLASMRDALLPKLMSGEIDVTNIDL